MNFSECAEKIERYFAACDLSLVEQDFSALLHLWGRDEGYVYLSCTGGRKEWDFHWHKEADILLDMKIADFAAIANHQIDPLKAFTSGKIQAQGNVSLALRLYQTLLQQGL